MAGFSGFTEEEILRLKMQGQGMDYVESTKREAVKKASLSNTGKRGKPREKIRTRQANSKSDKAVKEKPSTSPTASTTSETPGNTEEPLEVKNVDAEKAVEKPREVEVIMEPERVMEIELSNLQKMQQKQKEMEMINKKKEKMLQNTLKERYKRTKKETETLKMVQKELSHLDNLLYADVQILRDKIDEACREYDAARKRYEKAETEFINAKVNLHNKTETKDQLTEHLYSIIQENEERKAKKLAELMAKLEIADQDTESLCEETEAAKQAKDSDEQSKESGGKIISDLAPKSPQLEDKSLVVQGCGEAENNILPQTRAQSNNNQVSDGLNTVVERSVETKTEAESTLS